MRRRCASESTDGHSLCKSRAGGLSGVDVGEGVNRRCARTRRRHRCSSSSRVPDYEEGDGTQRQKCAPTTGSVTTISLRHDVGLLRLSSLRLSMPLLSHSIVVRVGPFQLVFQSTAPFQYKGVIGIAKTLTRDVNRVERNVRIQFRLATPLHVDTVHTHVITLHSRRVITIIANTRVANASQLRGEGEEAATGVRTKSPIWGSTERTQSNTRKGRVTRTWGMGEDRRALV